MPMMPRTGPVTRTLAGLLTAFALTCAGSHPSLAAPSGDWPCIQPRIPELSVATFWAGPPIDEGAVKAWRDNPDVAHLVTSIVSRRTPVETAETMIADFAGAHKDDKAGLMTLVFAGAFSELNTLRTQIVHGIERFTRNQRALSDTINKDRAELGDLTKPGEKTDQQRARIQELQTKVQWETRLHKERESTQRYVCETPVLLEQRVFSIARAVQNEM
jgi:hypothetical protein